MEDKSEIGSSYFIRNKEIWLSPKCDPSFSTEGIEDRNTKWLYENISDFIFQLILLREKIRHNSYVCVAQMQTVLDQLTNIVTIPKKRCGNCGPTCDFCLTTKDE